jgi:hypothetical protein
VTNDKNAHWIAARELLGDSERTLRFWTFLHRMQPLASLTVGAVQAIVAAPALQTDTPFWLASCLAELPSTPSSGAG